MVFDHVYLKNQLGLLTNTLEYYELYLKCQKYAYVLYDLIHVITVCIDDPLMYGGCPSMLAGDPTICTEVHPQYSQMIRWCCATCQPPPHGTAAWSIHTDLCPILRMYYTLRHEKWTILLPVLCLCNLKSDWHITLYYQKSLFCYVSESHNRG